jgi:hypothetical protein
MEDLRHIESWDDMRSEFGRFLGIEEPVPSEVLNHALENANYAAYLLSVRNQPKYLNILFKAPLNNKDTQAGTDEQIDKVDKNTTHEHSNRELLGKAAKALVNWGKSGFKTVDEATFEKRFSACQGCPFLQAAPDKLPYKIKLSKDSDMRVCGSCGCVAKRKAKLSSETCPEPLPENPELNRWHEKIQKAN